MSGCCQSCGVSNPCGATRCGSILCADAPCPQACPPRLKLPRVDISPYSPGICIGANVHVLALNADLSAVVMRVRQRGTAEWKFLYQAWDRAEDGGVCFRVDQNLCTLGERIEAEVLYLGLVFGHFELRVVPELYINVQDLKPLKRGRFPFNVLAPAGASFMFEPFYPLYAPLCQVLDAAASELPICLDPLNALCAIPVPEPVQFVLDDGINQEVVLYTGPTAGRVVVTRAQAGTQARRFPAGTVLRFAWTEFNVAAAMRDVT